MFKRLAVSLLLTSALFAAPDIVGRRDLKVHDPSTILRQDDTWWLYSTGIRVQVSKSKDLIHWERVRAALSEAPPWAEEVAPANKRHYYWAPDIIRLGERYLLYYSVSEFGKNTSAIGLATATSLDPTSPGGEWRDEGIVLRSRETDPYNAIDPSILHAADGRLWMAFGSFWSGLYLVELDPATGKRLTPDAPPIHLAYAKEIEAPTLYQRSGYTYLFVNHGLCCKGKDSTYRILVGRSKEVTGPYLDDQGRDLRDGAGRPFLASRGNFIGPGHPTILEGPEGPLVALHFYDGTQNGRSTLALRKLRWTEDGWPEIADGDETPRVKHGE